MEDFPARYVDEPDRWRDLLREFGPDDLRAWAAELGVETYVGTSGRVFPLGQKAAGLLRAWLRRLRASGVEFRTGSRLVGLGRAPDGWRAEFQTLDREVLAHRRCDRSRARRRLEARNRIRRDMARDSGRSRRGHRSVGSGELRMGSRLASGAARPGGRIAVEESHRARRRRIGLRRIAHHAPRTGGRRDLSTGPGAALDEASRVWRSISNHNSRSKRCANAPPLCPARAIGFAPGN